MGRYQYFPREIQVEGKKEAATTATGWEDKRHGRLQIGDEEVGAASVWWQDEGPVPPRWRGRGTGDWYTPLLRSGGSFTPREEQRGFGAELYALYQAMKTFEDRGESGRQYPIFMDPTAAMARAGSDNTGPGQRSCISITVIRNRLPRRKSYLQRIKKLPSNKCWWCGRDEVQSRHHLFVRCKARKFQIRIVDEGRRAVSGNTLETPQSPESRPFFVRRQEGYGSDFVLSLCYTPKDQQAR